MTNEKVFSGTELEILHDHYKETFARLLSAESSRNRLFVWLIVLFAVLSLEIGYPAAIGEAVGTITVAGGEFNLRALPLPALLSATWALTLALSLRYCQTSILIERQYPYLHSLEEVIAPTFGVGDTYQREGKVYLRDFPFFLDVAWLAYGFLFPLLVIVSTILLFTWECRELPYPDFHKSLDLVLGLAIIFVFVSYRILPAISKWRRRTKSVSTAAQ